MDIVSVKDTGNSYAINGNTFVPKDSESYLLVLIQEWIDAGNTPEPQFTPEELYAKEVVQFETAIQNLMDSEARALGYDSLLSACTYSGSKKPKFAKEGQAFADWRDDMWDYAYIVLADVEAGTRTKPSFDEFIIEAPKLVLV